MKRMLLALPLAWLMSSCGDSDSGSYSYADADAAAAAAAAAADTAADAAAMAAIASEAGAPTAADATTITPPRSQLASGRPSPERAEQIAAGINLSGYLCASVVNVSQLQAGGGQAYEVTCVEYRGGTGQVRYLIDLRTNPPAVNKVG